QWQHGDCTIGKIHRSAAQARFLVEPSITGHIMRHVGNIYLQLVVAIVQVPHQYRIVEVACCLAINRYDRQVAVVTPRGQFAGRDSRLNGFCLFQNLGRKTVGDVEFPDHDLHVDAEVAFISQNLDYAATRILSTSRPIGDLHIHDHVFQIVPFRPRRGFIPEHAMQASLAFLAPFFVGALDGEFLWKLHSWWYDTLLRDLIVDLPHVVDTVYVVTMNHLEHLHLY